MNIKVEIKNLAQIRSAFSKAPQIMAKNLNKAIQKSIFTIQSASMKRTPVDTGRLRASHQTLFSQLKGSVGPTAFYAPFVHWGTKFMKARPFLLNAVQSEENKVQGFFKDSVQDTLNEIARRSNG